MQKLKGLLGGLAMVAVLAVVQGCDSTGGGGAPAVSGSHDTAKVSGTASVKGKPLTSGKVMFDASNVNRKDVMPKSVDISKDGSFEIETYVGTNRVTVSSPELKDPKLMMMNQKSIEVSSGMAPITLDIGADAPAAAP